MTFNEKWRKRLDQNKFFCVGLDTHQDRLPSHLPRNLAGLLEFNQKIIDATCDLAGAFKPQFAHYGAQGAEEILSETIKYLRRKSPESLLILDAKRGDIGSTSDMYALEAFERYGADAVTLHPYMGWDTVKPFLKNPEKGAIVLCKTSNKSSSDFQDMLLQDGRPLYEHVAQKAKGWNDNDNVSLVVGATQSGVMKSLRALCGDELPFLIPGIGAQGGSITDVIRHGGLPGFLSASRSIIYASDGEDFAEAAREVLVSYQNEASTACGRPS